MDQTVHNLRRSILRFLDEQVLAKADDQRTPLDNLIDQTGRAFTDALARYERIAAPIPDQLAKQIASMLSGYRKITEDVDACAGVRDPDAHRE